MCCTAGRDKNSAQRGLNWCWFGGMFYFDEGFLWLRQSFLVTFLSGVALYFYCISGSRALHLKTATWWELQHLCPILKLIITSQDRSPTPLVVGESILIYRRNQNVFKSFCRNCVLVAFTAAVYIILHCLHFVQTTLSNWYDKEIFISNVNYHDPGHP